ncbi:4a-hydroxytetrahydrobiopterin dehydratase [candidate division KSB1 bacterium]
MGLTEKSCLPCRGGVPRLEGERLKEFMGQVEGWELESDTNIKKKYTFRDFKEALDFVNEVGRLAESEGHHPDIFVHYKEVTIDLWTHKIGGLFDNDFIMAAKIDAIGDFPRTFSDSL